jgi:hypothetical protein
MPDAPDGRKIRADESRHLQNRSKSTPSLVSTLRGWVRLTPDRVKRRRMDSVVRRMASNDRRDGRNARGWGRVYVYSSVTAREAAKRGC